MSSNRLRALSMLSLDADKEQMTRQLALYLAEGLKRFDALDSTNQQNTVTEMQPLLPPNINVTLAEGNFHVTAIPRRSYKNPMALPNILQENDLDIPPLPSLEWSNDPDTPDGFPRTPTDFESFEAMDTYPEEYISDNFDAVNWPSWIDNDVLSRYN